MDPTQIAKQRLTQPDFKLLADTANVAIVSAIASGQIIYCNSAAEELFGYQAGQLLDRAFSAVLAERVREMASREIGAVARASRDGKSKSMVLVGLRRDGTEFTAEASVNRWEPDGGSGVHIVLRDITQWLEIETNMRDRVSYCWERKRLTQITP